MVTRVIEIRRPAHDLDHEIFFGFDIIDVLRVYVTSSVNVSPVTSKKFGA